jgi:hypothetical protein
VTQREVLLRHPLAIAGALITTACAVVFIALVIAELAGLFESPYSGLVVFVALPAAFLFGLLLIPLGMWLQQRRLRRHPELPADWPVLDFRQGRVRRTALLFVALTAVNIVILLVAGYGSLHWMESPSFCGQVCHTPMHPQFMAWNNAAHSQVPCAQCHIGEGARGFVHAKLNGTRQLAHVALDSFPRPVPAGAEMPPGAQALTCLGCHKPGHVVGDQIRLIREYADDEKNTETLTVLQMHVGVGSASGRRIHWHADPSTRVEFIATDAGQQTIPYVRVTDAKGQTKEFRTADATDQMVSAGTLQRMDCVECHNAVGHPISATPERAVDGALSAALVSRDLPFVRREGVRLVKASYAGEDEAMRGIDRGLRSFYKSQGGSINQQAVAQAVAAFQDVYRRNVFPTMKVTWGTYPNNKGHIDAPGCVRCHDDSHKAKDGSAISGDCEYCHKQIEQRS